VNPLVISPLHALLALVVLLALNAGAFLALHKMYQRRLQRLCQYDQATGLANQQAIDCQLQHEWQRMQRGGHEFAIMGLHVDGLGEQLSSLSAADCTALLKAISTRLQNASREVDSLAHTGSGNFMALFPQSHLEGARTAAERLRLQFKETPFVVGKRQFNLSVRMGVALARQGDLALNDALLRMQAALGRAKKQPIDTVCVEAE
jgi:diguanylate cyclase (GGDEF)-like protein